MCWFHLFSKICLHCTWLVLSHIAEYHVKAITTTSLSCTDQTPRFFIQAFQTSYAQRHVAHSSKHLSRSRPCNSHLLLPVVLGVERSSVSRTAALMTLTPRSMPSTWASTTKPRPRTWSQRPRPRLRTWHSRRRPRSWGQGHGLEDSNTGIQCILWCALLGGVQWCMQRDVHGYPGPWGAKHTP